jgi:hypothetical protein
MSVSTRSARAAAEWIAVRARDTSDVDEPGGGGGGGSWCMVGPTCQWRARRGTLAREDET